MTGARRIANPASDLLLRRMQITGDESAPAGLQGWNAKPAVNRGRACALAYSQQPRDSKSRSGQQLQQIKDGRANSPTRVRIIRKPSQFLPLFSGERERSCLRNTRLRFAIDPIGLRLVWWRNIYRRGLCSGIWRPLGISPLSVC